MGNEQTHPLHETDKKIIDSIITKKTPEDLDYINLARLINRYTNFPGEIEIKNDIEKILNFWKITRNELFSKTKKAFKDRFGKIPTNLKNLFLVMQIKKFGSLMAIDKITNKNNKLTLTFDKNSKQNDRKNITIQEIFNFTKKEEKKDKWFK